MYYFYLKSTGDRIFMSSFDSNPTPGSDVNGSYLEYENDEYPGIRLREYKVDGKAVRLEVSYNNYSETVVITPSDFAGY